MKFSKKNLVASVVSLIMVSAVMAEESAKSWDKIVMAGIGIPLARHKVEIGGEKKNLNSQGGGLFTEYVTIEKETNLSLVLNGTVGGYLSDDFPSGRHVDTSGVVDAHRPRRLYALWHTPQRA